jgi:hypothetical protein
VAVVGFDVTIDGCVAAWLWVDCAVFVFVRCGCDDVVVLFGGYPGTLKFNLTYLNVFARGFLKRFPIHDTSRQSTWSLKFKIQNPIEDLLRTS